MVEKSKWASASVQGRQQQDQAACWREEEGERGAGDKHAGMSFQQKGTPRESVPQNDQGDGKTNVRSVSDSRDEAASAGWEEGIKRLSQIAARS